jgi:hypothetical protein
MKKRWELMCHCMAKKRMCLKEQIVFYQTYTYNSKKEKYANLISKR